MLLSPHLLFSHFNALLLLYSSWWTLLVLLHVLQHSFLCLVHLFSEFVFFDLLFGVFPVPISLPLRRVVNTNLLHNWSLYVWLLLLLLVLLPFTKLFLNSLTSSSRHLPYTTLRLLISTVKPQITVKPCINGILMISLACDLLFLLSVFILSH